MSGMDAALKAVAAKSLDEAIVNTCIGMGIGVTLALVMIKSGKHLTQPSCRCGSISAGCSPNLRQAGVFAGRPFIRGFTAGVGTGVGAGIAYVHADERYLRYQSEQLNTLPAEKR